jgi:predicted transcriptional regulator
LLIARLQAMVNQSEVAKGQPITWHGVSKELSKLVSK